MDIPIVILLISSYIDFSLVKSHSKSVRTWPTLRRSSSEYDLHSEHFETNNLPKTLKLVMQFSSLGSKGKDGKLVDYYASRMLPSGVQLVGSQHGKVFQHSPTRNSTKHAKLEIIWPTVECVRNSLQGYAAGQSLPCASKNLIREASGKPSFLPGFSGRMGVWDGRPSGRNRATPHMKCYFAYREKDSSPGGGFSSILLL